MADSYAPIATRDEEYLPTRRFGPADDELPPNFQPLHLLLQPSGLSIILTRANVLVGRHSEADIRLPMPDVSRRHCRFLYTAHGWRVVDLQSMNGIIVNDKVHESVILQDGDRVKIGSFQFLVRLPSKDSETHLADSIGDNRTLQSIADRLPPAPHFTAERRRVC